MDVRGVSEGGASIPIPPRRGAPSPPRRGGAARAPRDFASETFRGFCGRARGVNARGPGRISGEGAGENGRVAGSRRTARGEERNERRRGLGGKTTVFPLIERLARGRGAHRGGVEGRITCSNYLFLLRSASPCLAPASNPRGSLAATCWKSFLASARYCRTRWVTYRKSAHRVLSTTTCASCR